MIKTLAKLVIAGIIAVKVKEKMEENGMYDAVCCRIAKILEDKAADIQYRHGGTTVNIISD